MKVSFFDAGKLRKDHILAEIENSNVVFIIPGDIVHIHLKGERIRGKVVQRLFDFEGENSELWISLSLEETF